MVETPARRLPDPQTVETPRRFLGGTFLKFAGHSPTAPRRPKGLPGAPKDPATPFSGLGPQGSADLSLPGRLAGNFVRRCGRLPGLAGAAAARRRLGLRSLPQIVRMLRRRARGWRRGTQPLLSRPRRQLGVRSAAGRGLSAPAATSALCARSRSAGSRCDYRSGGGAIISNARRKELESPEGTPELEPLGPESPETHKFRPPLEPRV